MASARSQTFLSALLLSVMNFELDQRISERAAFKSTL